MKMKYLTPQRVQPTVWDFMSEVERLFDDSWKTDSDTTSTRSMSLFQPRIDIKETEGHYLIAADLPGMNRNQIKINVENGRLILSGERSEEKVEDTATSHRRERVFGKFERSFQLPVGVNEDQIQARLEEGVLEVLIPKPLLAKPKAVSIEGEKKGLFSKLLNSTPNKSRQSSDEESDSH